MVFLRYLTVLLLVVFVLLSVAFVTFYERHVLSLRQGRLGPNKVRLFGVLQAVLDGVKLMKKEQVVPSGASSLSFLLFPGLVFAVLLLQWFTLPFWYFLVNFQFSFLFLLCLVGFSVYGTLLSSVMRKSKYSSLGGVRARRQSVSFEIAFSLYFLCFLFILKSFELSLLIRLCILFLFFPFLMIVLAELGRAPFDFSEGERELVRGYNTEFSSVTFVLLFLGEYGVLLFFSVLMSLLFFFMSVFCLVFLFSSLLFIRRCFPRFRYDFLMAFF